MLHPVAYLSQSLIKAERDYTIFDKELLAIIAAFKEWRHYLEGNPNRLHAIVYTDHRNLESFMTTKQLTCWQARWAETMGCFNFDIVFCPSEEASRPDALSRRPDLKFDEKDQLSFGQLLKPKNLRPNTFSAISAFDSLFEDKSIDIDNADHWFSVDVLNVDPIATASSVLSCPIKPSLPDLPVRDARQLDEGVCTSNTLIGCSILDPNSTLAPPQCECDTSPFNVSPVSAGQPSSPL